jgi:hypothetical protein
VFSIAEAVKGEGSSYLGEFLREQVFLIVDVAGVDDRPFK